MSLLGQRAARASTDTLQAAIEELWDRRASLDSRDHDALAVVQRAIDALDRGVVRVAELRPDGTVLVREWLRQAIQLLFRLSDSATMEVGPFEFVDKLPLKRDFASKGVRVVPGASARWGAYLEPGVILMPSYVNIGARVGANSLIDTWATVGSCAQIGANVHLSGGVGIGGVLEPPQAEPVIVEDDAFVGSRSMIIEGGRVGRGAVVGAGVVLSKSIPVIDVESGAELSRGVVPPWCVAVGGTRVRHFPGGDFGLPCVLVVKRLVEGARHEKAMLNELVRDVGAAL